MEPLITASNANSTATAMANAPVNGHINIITVVSPGSGYVTAPTVTITGGGGSGAIASANILAGSGSVSFIGVINPGANYTSVPVVTLSAPPLDLMATTYWSNDGTSVNGSQPTNSVILAVTDGVFTVTLGDTTLGNMQAIPTSLITSQTNLQLQIWFNDGTHGFAALNPPQTLTPTPYATYAANVSAANILGTIPATNLPVSLITNGATGVNITGSFSGNGGGLTNLNAAQLTGVSAATPPLIGAPILNMVWIPPGTFIMGSPTSDPDSQSDERPQTVVTLTSGFWMGHHPVTQGEYLSVTGTNPSWYTGDVGRPVETVSWLDATNFCGTLTLREQSAERLPTGFVYRLPTEAEWEYCCRALTTSRFYFGNDPGDTTSATNYIWYVDNSGGETQPVGQLPANPWGLVDMAGNVFEWCLDLYGAYPGGSVVNPSGATSGSPRVYRGGSESSHLANCRSAARGLYYPGLKDTYLGFRVVLAQNVTTFPSTNIYPPIVLTCSSNLTVMHTSTNGANVFFTLSASGGCYPPVISSSPISGGTFPIGTNTVTVTASDNCGDTNTCSFTVTVY